MGNKAKCWDYFNKKSFIWFDYTDCFPPYISVGLQKKGMQCNEAIVANGRTLKEAIKYALDIKPTIDGGFLWAY